MMRKENSKVKPISLLKKENILSNLIPRGLTFRVLDGLPPASINSTPLFMGISEDCFFSEIFD